MGHEWVLWVLVTASALHVSAAMVGWSAPGFALGFAALNLINAVFFHVVPSIRARRTNPGLATACLLYVPIGIWAYAAASADGVLDAGTLVLSLLVGATAMGSALAMLVLGARNHYPDRPAAR